MSALVEAGLESVMEVAALLPCVVTIFTDDLGQMESYFFQFVEGVLPSGLLLVS